jgi:hypothetical protein
LAKNQAQNRRILARCPRWSDILTVHRLHFNHTNQVSIVLHMISGVGRNGSLGLTAVANSPQEAADLYERVQEVLDEEAETALFLATDD